MCILNKIFCIIGRTIKLSSEFVIIIDLIYLFMIIINFSYQIIVSYSFNIFSCLFVLRLNLFITNCIRVSNRKDSLMVLLFVHHHQLLSYYTRQQNSYSIMLQFIILNGSALNLLSNCVYSNLIYPTYMCKFTN